MTETRTVTTTPTALAGLRSGGRFGIQNVSPDSVVFWASSATEPDRSAPAHRIRPYEWLRFEEDSAEPAWVWTARGGARLIISEAV